MYQDPFPKHGKDKGLSSHSIPYDYTINITRFDSLVGRIEPIDTHVNTITIQGADLASRLHSPRVTIMGAPLAKQSFSPTQAKIVIQGASPSNSSPQNDCSVTTHRGRVAIQGAPPPPPPASTTSTNQYIIL